MSTLLTFLGVALLIFLGFVALAFGVVRTIIRTLLGRGSAQQPFGQQRSYQQHTQQSQRQQAHRKASTSPTTIGADEGEYVDFVEIKE